MLPFACKFMRKSKQRLSGGDCFEVEDILSEEIVRADADAIDLRTQELSLLPIPAGTLRVRLPELTDELPCSTMIAAASPHEVLNEPEKGTFLSVKLVKELIPKFDGKKLVH